MILLLPDIADQPVSIFVKSDAASYDAILTNQSTKEKNAFPINIVADGTTFDGNLIFTLPVVPKKNTFYTLILSVAGNREHYSICYCGDDLAQQCHRLKGVFTQPTKEAITYNMPVKS